LSCLQWYPLTSRFFLDLNVIFTLFFGLITLIAWESSLKLPVRIIAVIFIDALTFVLGCEWMIFGVLIILGLHIFRDSSKIRFIWFFICIFCLNFIMNGLVLSMTFWVGFLLQLLAYFLMIKCYNGKRGKHPHVAKWFFYIFYPLHFLIIYIVQMIFASP